MKQFLTNLLAGFLFTALFVCIGLSFALFFRPFYYMEIDRLQIVETSGYDKEEIIENYNALIDYCSPFYQGELVFPTFSSSKEALIHFEEVKRIFQLFFGAGLLSFLVLLILCLQKRKARDWAFLRFSSLFSIILPLLTGVFCAVNFNQVFILFHKLFFRNDYWLFSPDTDPVITILPEAFFMDAAIVIIAFILLGSAALEISFRLLRKKNRN